MKTINNDIKETYCSFDASQKIWRRGGRLKSPNCFTYSVNHPNGKGWYEDLDGELSISRPTHSLAIEWLRVNFGVCISSHMSTSGKGVYDIWVINKIPEKGWKRIKTQYGFDFIKDANESALLYVLNNLEEILEYEYE